MAAQWLDGSKKKSLFSVPDFLTTLPPPPVLKSVSVEIYMHLSSYSIWFY